MTILPENINQNNSISELEAYIRYMNERINDFGNRLEQRLDEIEARISDIESEVNANG